MTKIAVLAFAIAVAGGCGAPPSEVASETEGIRTADQTIYRLWKVQNGQLTHFLTTDWGEVQNAVAGGYTYEFPIGHCWSPPSTPYIPPPVTMPNGCYETNSNSLAGYPTGPDGDIPFYRFTGWNTGPIGDHFYTSWQPEATNVAKDSCSVTCPCHYVNGFWQCTSNSSCSGNWAQEAGLCNIFESQAAGTIPLYRALSPSGWDHLYTTDWNEIVSVEQNLGYTYEGVQGYINP